MSSWHAAGAALTQQPPELESGEGETAGMPPPASRPPGACRRQHQQCRRTGQKVKAGRQERPCHGNKGKKIYTNLLQLCDAIMSIWT